ncbi:MAG: ferrous iron transport protein B [Chitinophagales bacterium]
MNDTKRFKIALLGNPNSGKSSIFNLLTGLRQKVGNFPGVTVDKKLGTTHLTEHIEASIIDFPGTYSLYPTSKDETIVINTFANPKDENFPDAVIYIADITKLEPQLLLFTQIRDLGIPIVLAVNMIDLAAKERITYDLDKLSKLLHVPVVAISGRSGENIEKLKNIAADLCLKNSDVEKTFYKFSKKEQQLVADLQTDFNITNPYRALIYAHHYDKMPFLSDLEKKQIENLGKQHEFESFSLQIRETMQRYDKFTPIVRQVLQKINEETDNDTISDKLDVVFTHKVFGPIIFFLLMFLVFQAIFAWSEFPMALIETTFGFVGETLQNVLPEGWITDLLTEGILAGLGGILIFIPQIAILFFLISILEEVGYMARAVFIFDKLMQKFGLNGRSIVALVSGGACAIPAIMSTRTISNWKERLITIMVTPLISCSARIPVYTVLVGFVVPSITVWGIFNAQGLIFTGLYLLGIVAALLSAWVFKLILQTEESSFLMIELPKYRVPMIKNVLLIVKERVMTFTIEAGKVIMVISIVLWVLASYGPTTAMNLAEQTALEMAAAKNLDETATADLVAGKKIEASFAGHIGKFIEPAIEPLGFDWKIGIALITSFAAREVFVGTMATIYSIGSQDDEYTIRDRLAKATNPDTGLPVYTMATSLSLLIFYVFAMQCMSTLAVVKRETKSWKWAAIQFVYMTAMAYFGSLGVYQLLS